MNIVTPRHSGNIITDTLNNVAVQTNWPSGIEFYYWLREDDYASEVPVFLFKAYPKDQNPRRHLRDLLPENQRI